MRSMASRFVLPSTKHIGASRTLSGKRPKKFKGVGTHRLLYPAHLTELVYGYTSNSMHKNILYRVLRYRKRGIQLVFVFDGQGRPKKHGKFPDLGENAEADIALLKDTLREIGVPYWQAPGEAEAECAAMQLAGVVDAVWSGDGDTLMFGAKTQIRFCPKPARKANGEPVMQKSMTHIQVTEASDVVKKNRGLDRKGIVLFALLVGGDYDEPGKRGLVGCGTAKALKAIESGLGSSLASTYTCNKPVDAWRAKLSQHFVQNRCSIAVPPSFPDQQKLKYYSDPLVSQSSELIARMGCNDFWNPKVNEDSLYVHICEMYNFSVQEYIKWFPQVFLVGELLSKPDKNKYDIAFAAEINQQEYGHTAMSRISYKIAAMVNQKTLSEWPVKITKARTTPYVFEERETCDIPSWILDVGLPSLARNIAATKSAATKDHSFTKKRGRPKKESLGTRGVPSTGSTERLPLQDQSFSMTNRVASSAGFDQDSFKRRRGRPRKNTGGGTRQQETTRHAHELSSEVGNKDQTCGKSLVGQDTSVATANATKDFSKSRRANLSSAKAARSASARSGATIIDLTGESDD
jgi:Holliday junction resolvase YEN1